MDLTRFVFSLGLVCIIVIHTKGKILRSGRKFIATFSLINANSRLKTPATCVKNITRNLTPTECATECGEETKCQSFNHHIEKGFCELLNITKFDLRKGLDRDLKWKHYETDDDEDMIGARCIGISECGPYRICEETFQCPGYICKCRDGFNGSKCDEYIGAGKTKKKRAASCHFLFMRFRAVPDGLYWIKGFKEQVNCTRRVDGAYSSWGLFEACSQTCGSGVMIRRRTCTNPPPKGGGSDCSDQGSDTETKSCFLKHCNDGGYSPWSNYTTCRTLCGTGIVRRYRNCSNPYPSHGGRNCSHLGKSEETMECHNETQCPEIFEINLKYISSYVINTTVVTERDGCIKHCTSFPRCNVWSFNMINHTCHAMIGVEKKEYAANVVSGFRNVSDACMKNRTIDSIKPIDTFKNITSVWKCSDLCRNNNLCSVWSFDVIYRDCRIMSNITVIRRENNSISGTSLTGKKCLVDSDYSPWSLCRTLCGTGIIRRYRNCSNTLPMYGGRNCSHLGKSEETMECHNETQCPEIFENNLKYTSSYVINTTVVTDRDGCIKHCTSFPRCNVWSLNMTNDICHAMIGMERKEYAVNVVSGFRTITDVFMMNRTINSTKPINIFKNISSDWNCSELCRANKLCSVWSFNVSHQICRIMANITSVQTAKNAISGTVLTGNQSSVCTKMVNDTILVLPSFERITSKTDTIKNEYVLTIIFKVKKSDMRENRKKLIFTLSNNLRIYLRRNQDKTEFQLNMDGQIETNKDIYNHWINITIVKSKGHIKVFLNGTPGTINRENNLRKLNSLTVAAKTGYIGVKIKTFAIKTDFKSYNLIEEYFQTSRFCKGFSKMSISKMTQTSNIDRIMKEFYLDLTLKIKANWIYPEGRKLIEMITENKRLVISVGVKRVLGNHLRIDFQVIINNDITSHQTTKDRSFFDSPFKFVLSQRKTYDGYLYTIAVNGTTEFSRINKMADEFEKVKLNIGGDKYRYYSVGEFKSINAIGFCNCRSNNET